MKSLMEEASSVAKAIEKCWLRAGKPQEFTVKVFEEPQKNFIGLTTKPAKIGLFFEPSSIKAVESKDKRLDTNRSHRPMPQRSLKEEVAFEFQKNNTPQKQQPQKRFSHADRPLGNKSQEKSSSTFERPLDKNKPYKNEVSPSKESIFTSPWNDDLTLAAKDWIKQSLQVMGYDQNFNAQVDRYALRVTFIKPLTQNGEKEKMLFRSWSFLLMQALRQKYKRPLKGLKIILMSNA